MLSDSTNICVHCPLAPPPPPLDHPPCAALQRLAPLGSIALKEIEPVYYQLNYTNYEPKTLSYSVCCTPKADCSCSIDVSGTPGISKLDKALGGRDAGDNGKNGEDGTDGAQGGSITLRLPATSLLSSSDDFVLRLEARGGDGGHGQEGGNGAAGATGTASSSTCNLPWNNNPGRRLSEGYCMGNSQYVRCGGSSMARCCCVAPCMEF